MPGNVRFFGKGGMRAGHYDEWLLNDNFDDNNTWMSILGDLLQFNPSACFICLGGNDIKEESNPADIVQKILRITDKMKDCGVRKIYISEISERGCFKKSPGLTKESFEIKRNAINKKLKKIFKDDFVTFKSVRYPGDYDDDLVHFGDGDGKKGLKKYFFAIRGLFCSYKTTL